MTLHGNIKSKLFRFSICIYAIRMFQYQSVLAKVKRNLIPNKLGVRVASRFAERLQTQDLRNLGSIRKFQVKVETQPGSQSLFQNLNFGNSSQKNTQKQISNFSGLVIDIFDVISILVQIFCLGLSEKANFLP